VSWIGAQKSSKYRTQMHLMCFIFSALLCLTTFSDTSLSKIISAHGMKKIGAATTNKEIHCGSFAVIVH